jgi:phosphohistidine phosphatase
MKSLLILRHAKSSWKDPNLADHDRPLNKRGKRDAPRMGRLMRLEGLEPDLILCSTAKRARQTAEAVVEEHGYEGEILLDRELYSFDYEPYLEALTALSDEFGCVMIVGHNPAMEELIEALTGEYQRFPTAALAELNLPITSWREADEIEDGELVNLWRPKELGEG